MNKLSILSILAGVSIVGISSSLYCVDPGQRALIMNNITGLKKKVYGQGYHFKIPMIQNVILYDIRINQYDLNVSTGTKDLQTVSLALRIFQKPIIDSLPTIHQLLGRSYEKKVFNSIGQQVARTVIAQYDADQLLKNRQNISRQIKGLLFEKAKDFNILVEDVSFMNLSFSREYSSAIERRAVQQQLAQKQKFIVLRDQQLKSAAIIRAEAQAEAAKLINNSVAKFGSTQIEIKKLQAAKSIAQLLQKNPNITFVPSNNAGNLLNLKV